jgi:serine/threonine protein kinase
MDPQPREIVITTRNIEPPVRVSVEPGGNVTGIHRPKREIVITTTGGEKLARILVEPGEYVIGRDPSCNIVVDLDLVSRRHALLIVNYHEVIIEDLGSVNGTYVADQRITGAVRLWPNQKIRIAASIIEVNRIKSKGEPISPWVEDLHNHLPPALLREKKYTIVKVSAQGGMGLVLDAHEATIGRKVAMKVMRQEGSHENLGRFIEEARITGLLEHPNIVPVHELGVDQDDQVFYTMKYVQGVTLREVLDNLRAKDAGTIARFPLRRLLIVFLRVCDAVAFAHSKGIIHRDIKPENVMIGGFGEVLLMDWGLAKKLGGKEEPKTAAPAGAASAQGQPGGGRTLDGMVIGTPHFMPPEQAHGEVDKTDARSDIYTLGGILFNILTLRTPITGESSEEALENARTAVIPSPASFNTEKIRKTQGAISLPHCPGRRIPDSLSAVAMKALSREPADRYQTATELRNEVDAFLGGFATSAERAGFFKQATLLINRNKALALSIMASIVIIVGISAVFLHRLIADRNFAQSTVKELQSTAPTFYEEALALIDDQKFDEALEKISYACTLQPRNADYHRVEGNIYQSLLRLDEAVAAYSKAIALDPNQKQARMSLELTKKIASENPDSKNIRMSALADLQQLMRNQDRISESLAMMTPLGKNKRLVYRTWVEILRKAFPFRRPADFLSMLRMDTDGLFEFDAGSLKFTDLAILKGMPLKSLRAGGRITDLRPLQGMPLKQLYLDYTHVSDLSPLQGMQLSELSLDGAPVSDLRPLAGMPLVSLNLERTTVSDLLPLKGMHLNMLNLAYTDVSDISPLRWMPLKELSLWRTHVTDLSALGGMPLEKLTLCGSRVQGLDALRGMKLIYLMVEDCNISDIEPLRGLPLEELSISRTRVTDLGPLRDMRLRTLRIEGTPVRDISYLRRLPLTSLGLADCNELASLRDIAELKQLRRLTFPSNIKDVDFLRHLPNIERISNHALTVSSYKTWEEVPLVSDFWKSHDAPGKN